MATLVRTMNYLFKEAKLGPDFCKKELTEIKKLIDQSTSFSVVGIPAMGISIFLKYLVTTKLAEFVHIDINDLPSLDKLSFLKLIYKELGGDKENTSEQGLIDLIKRKLETIITQHERVVIVFNRFDRLKKEFNQNFFANLRSIRDVDKEKIVMVFAANHPLPHEAPQALIGGNLNMFSKTFYLKPYSKEDLEKLTELNAPNLKTGDEFFYKALRLSGGHYQLCQLLLKSDPRMEDPLSDQAIKLQVKELYEYLNYKQRRQLQKLALGKKLSRIDRFLTDIGFIDQQNNLLSPLLVDYIKLNVRFRLSVKESQLFQLLKNKKGKLVSKDEIFSGLWGEDNEEATDWALNSLIYRLRKNPTFIASGYIIESQKKVGYSLIKV